MYEISVEDHFTSAHSLKCRDGTWEKPHRHVWKVSVVMRSGTLDSTGVVADFGEVRHCLKAVLAEFHGKSFNDHPAFRSRTLNPSTENIAKLIYDQLQGRLQFEGVRLAKVVVWETPDASASYCA